MTLTYTNMPLDRCTNQRKNNRWLSAEFNHPDTLFCLINEGKVLFKETDKITPLYLTKPQLTALNIDSCIYLGKIVLDKNSVGEYSSGSFFALDFNKLRFSDQETLEPLGQWHSLRQVTSLLTATDAAILALAKGLMHWHKTNQYCGHCGNTSRSTEAGHVRKCTECRNLTFPRTDPAVIMLVERMFDDGIARCLLGRQSNWPEGVYSTLAGFVDPGESLEEAVIREVLEESGIKVDTPQYIASQPWPFPASVMLGFTAVATNEVIDISEDSLEVAQWFTRQQLKSFMVNSSAIDTENQVVTSGHNEKNHGAAKPEKSNYKMSSTDSISSHLINAWLHKKIGKH